MRKILLTSFIVLSFGALANEIELTTDTTISNSNVIFQKNEILKSLLIKDGILNPYEKDKVVISIALINAKDDKSYIERVNTIYDEQSISHFSKIKTEKKETEILHEVKAEKPIHKSETTKKDKTITDLQKKIDKLDLEIEILVKNNTKLLELEQKSREILMKEQIKIQMLETRIRNLENSKETGKKYFPPATQKYDNNWRGDR